MRHNDLHVLTFIRSLLCIPRSAICRTSLDRFRKLDGTAVNQHLRRGRERLIFSDAAAATATIVKRARTCCSCLAIAVGLHYGERAERDPNGGTAPAHLWQRVKGPSPGSSSASS